VGVEEFGCVDDSREELRFRTLLRFRELEETYSRSRLWIRGMLHEGKDSWRGSSFGIDEEGSHSLLACDSELEDEKLKLERQGWERALGARRENEVSMRTSTENKSF